MMEKQHLQDFHRHDRQPYPPIGKPQPPAPPFKGKDGNVLLILTLFDVTGRRMRVRDCKDLKIYVWTINPNNYLIFNKRDVK